MFPASRAEAQGAPVVVEQRLKQAHYIALGSVLGLTLTLLLLPGRSAERLKLAVGSVFAPLFSLTGSGQQLAGKAVRAATPRQSLASQNEQLKNENAQLRIRLQEAESMARENERLRGLLGWSKTSPWKVKLGRVVGRDPANWWRAIHVDLGRRDGVRPDLPVLAPEGLVGRVVEVSETRCRVALLGDPVCRVAALVVEGRQAVDTGVLSGGTTVADPTLVELSYLSRSSGVKPGQTVVTSGLGEVFPKGIRIGYVVDVRPIEYGLCIEARVRLAVNLNQLEEVWIMVP